MTVLLLAALTGVGCVHSHHMTLSGDFDLPAELSEARRVKAEASQSVILGFAKNTDYAKDAYERLGATCVNGTVTGIQTRYSARLGFFSWQNQIKMWGYCFD